jgi:hypothetical protein
MKWTRRWTTELVGAAAWRVWFDAPAESLLVADGWRVAFASLSVRRVDVHTGRVVATVRTRTPIRAVGRSPGSDGEVLLLLGDKKIFAHDAQTLVRRAEYSGHVPRYANGICSLGETRVALAAPNALVEYDLAASRVARRVSKAPAVALDTVDGRPIAVLADGSVLSREGSWDVVARFDEPCYSACIDTTSGMVAGLAGIRTSPYDAEGRPQGVPSPRSRSLHLGCLRGGWAPRRVRLPFDVAGVAIVGDRIVGIAVEGGQTRVTSHRIDQPDSEAEVGAVAGTWVGSAGPHGFLVATPQGPDASAHLSLHAAAGGLFLVRGA